MASGDNQSNTLNQDPNGTGTFTAPLLVEDGVVYDNDSRMSEFVPLGTIQFDKEVPADWPCQWFFLNATGQLQHEQGWARIKRLLLVGAVIFVYILAHSADSVIITRISKTLGPVMLLFSESIYPAMFLPIIWLMIGLRKLFHLCCTKTNPKTNSSSPIPVADKSDSSADIIELDPRLKHCCDFVNRKYLSIMFWIAVCDALSSLLMILPLTYMDSVLVRILNQIYIPINVLMGYFYAGKRYKIPHIVGVFVILNSALTMFLSMALKNNNTIEVSYTDVIWFTLIVLSKLPAAFSENYKEWHLKEKNLDVWCMNGWVALIQLLMSFPLTLVVLIPTPTGSTPINFTDFVSSNGDISPEITRPVTWDNLVSYLYFGWGCVFGDFIGQYPTSLYTNETDDMDVSTIFVDNGIQCQGLGWQTMVFMIINVIFNVFATDLLKLTTANVSALLSVFTLTVTNIVFCFQSLAGPAYHPYQHWDIVALFGACLGIISFWALPEIMRKKMMEERSTKEHDELSGHRNRKRTGYSKWLLCNMGCDRILSILCYPCFNKDQRKQYGDVQKMSVLVRQQEEEEQNM